MSPRQSPRSTVPAVRPAKRARTPPPPKKGALLPLAHPRPAPRREVGRIMDDSESSLLDVIDNLLNRGVVLNADVILALANVDLVYIRLSALLCAADRVRPEQAG